MPSPRLVTQDEASSQRKLGPSRRGAMIYSHASGREISETLDQARKIMANGIKAVRLSIRIQVIEIGHGARRAEDLIKHPFGVELDDRGGVA